MGDVKAREGWHEAHLGASSQATKSPPEDATYATRDLGETSLTSHTKVHIIAIIFPCHTNIKVCSKTEPELDTSDDGSIIDHNQEGIVSDKGGSGTEDGMEDDSDGDTRSTMMPTATNCQFMNCHDASTSHISTNCDDALLTGSLINSHDASKLKLITHPFIDNLGTSARNPSIESHNASTIHQSVDSHITATLPSHPPINGDSHDSGTSEMQPFFHASELTRAG